MFSISGRGTVVTGRVERGVIVGDEIEIVGIKDTQVTTARALRCSASCLTAVRRATMRVFYCAARSARKLSAVRYCVRRADHAAYEVQG